MLLLLPLILILMGLMFGLAKELSGGLSLPIGMHVGNNTLAWAVSIGSSLK